VADECSAKINAPFHTQRRVRFDLLREKFCEHNLLREIFRSDNNCFFVSRSASRRNHGKENTNKIAPIEKKAFPHSLPENRRLISGHAPLQKSQHNIGGTASNAAGIAPARITWLFTIATPRK